MFRPKWSSNSFETRYFTFIIICQKETVKFLVTKYVEQFRRFSLSKQMCNVDCYGKLRFIVFVSHESGQNKSHRIVTATKSDTILQDSTIQSHQCITNPVRALPSFLFWCSSYCLIKAARVLKIETQFLCQLNFPEN